MRAAPRHARHPAPVPPAPVSVDPGVVAAPTALVVVKCALVPATPCNQHHHSSRNRARRTPLTPSVLARRTPPRSRPLQPPRPSPPRTPVRQSCPAACCQRATPPPAGHARRPETRQAPRSRPLPPAAASRVQAASAACLLSLPHTRPRAARTCLRWCRPLRLARAASRRTTRPCRSHIQTCACPCPAAASPFLATVRDEFARG